MSQQTGLPLAAIRFDSDCQTRMRIDPDTVEDYALRMKDGAAFPPITVFFDGAEYWLADGFHRYAAAKVLARERGDEATATIACDIRRGGRLDAVRFALAANAAHGKRREPGDYIKGYETACKLGLVEPHDVEGVRAVLACSERWARELTQPARDRRDAERAAEIAALKAEGLSNREIARQTGVPSRTVDRGTAPERQSAEMAHARNEVSAPGCGQSSCAAGGENDATKTAALRAKLKAAAARIDRPSLAHWNAVMCSGEQLLGEIRIACGHPVPRAMWQPLHSLLNELRNAFSSFDPEIEDEDA